MLTWASSTRLPPTDSPASRIRTSTPLSIRCAAAARPQGPAPMTATGESPHATAGSGDSAGGEVELHSDIAVPLSWSAGLQRLFSGAGGLDDVGMPFLGRA